MDKYKLFFTYFVNKKTSLLNSIGKAKDARDNAPSAMESHSDTRRSQAEKLVVALEMELGELLKIEKKINDVELMYIEAEIDSKFKNFLIVPKGMGGSELEEIRFLSMDTPLGELFKNKRTGDTFGFNSQKLRIIKME